VGEKPIWRLGTQSQFVAAGLNPTKIWKIWGAAAFYVFDPEGNRIEYWSGGALS
jgi:hypothetical protein